MEYPKGFTEDIDTSTFNQRTAFYEKANYSIFKVHSMQDQLELVKNPVTTGDEVAQKEAEAYNLMLKLGATIEEADRMVLEPGRQRAA